jgi:hypothetical protein
MDIEEVIASLVSGSWALAKGVGLGSYHTVLRAVEVLTKAVASASRPPTLPANRLGHGYNHRGRVVNIVLPEIEAGVGLQPTFVHETPTTSAAIKAAATAQDNTSVQTARLSAAKT